MSLSAASALGRLWKFAWTIRRYEIERMDEETGFLDGEGDLHSRDVMSEDGTLINDEFEMGEWDESESKGNIVHKRERKR